MESRPPGAPRLGPSQVPAHLQDLPVMELPAPAIELSISMVPRPLSARESANLMHRFPWAPEPTNEHGTGVVPDAPCLTPSPAPFDINLLPNFALPDAAQPGSADEVWMESGLSIKKWTRFERLCGEELDDVQFVLQGFELVDYESEVSLPEIANAVDKLHSRCGMNRPVADGLGDPVNLDIKKSIAGASSTMNNETSPILSAMIWASSTCSTRASTPIQTSPVISSRGNDLLAAGSFILS